MNCHACGAKLATDRTYALSVMVSSDCQPVTEDVTIASCGSCGLVQKPPTDVWKAMCDKIYANYQVYHQSDGQEQKARGVTGTFAPRSDLLTERLNAHAALPQTGKAIDIGCGNGAFLRAFNARFPEWELVGSDLNTTFASDVTSIATGTRFLTIDELSQSDEKFDLITLIHSIEHIPGPIEYLAGLKRHMHDGSRLLIEVPDAATNPADLMIADHTSHFDATSLRMIAERAGYDVEDCGNLVLGKELTLIAKSGHQDLNHANKSQDEPDRFLDQNLAWLERLATHGEELAAQGKMGVFGSSIAATWLTNRLGGSVTYFVDEDKDRVGRKHMNRPILDASEIPADTTVFVALEPGLSRIVSDRLRDAGVKARIEPTRALTA